ncbi:Signal peptidase I [Paramagnetospirillum magnetotacticum MS-1]|uniref:Signal peptidase I n=1 Tax=Paramagnetospirillum magnetotacticum MS-1 TaxID=272627 RepID=A0A0C2YUC9_PARME|nr:signal peptidase I [Paramagnetospirillum magnetotacticum]KIL98728.1 Signal peptidase I [Paramagnetospirillum magnetotacticum MS-1]
MSKGKSGGMGETIRTIVYAMLIAGSVRTLAFEPFNIPSGSMIPSLLIGDYLFVSKYAYGYSRYSMPFGIGPGGGRIMEHMPERGDVIVFKKPPENKVDYIKRVVGLPGDRIQVKGGILHINGSAVDRKRIEDFVERDRDGNILRAPQYIETLPNGRKHKIIEFLGDNGPADNTMEYLVPAGHYFMMGDNRDNSADSRFLSEVGYVPAENLVGRAEILFFSGDGSAALWEVWRWPWAIRYARLLQGIE